MLVTLIIFFAILTQATSGFGMALVAMSLLISLLGVGTAAPLVNLIAVTTQLVMLTRYRQAFVWQEVVWLIVPSLTAVPLGVGLVGRIDERVATAVLGIVLIGYALYALLDWWLPALKSRRWALGFGFIGGLLSGAYNTSGPPVIIYATCRRWPPEKFKGNLQMYFLTNSVMTMASHAVAGNFNQQVLGHYVWALPGVVLGFALGFSLDRFFNPQRFRQFVLLLLIVLGIRLLF